MVKYCWKIKVKQLCYLRQKKLLYTTHIVNEVPNIVSESDDSYFNYNYPDTDAFVSPSKRFKESTTEPKPEVPTSAKSLIDIASQAVGKHYPCEILESCEPPLDESLLKKVSINAGLEMDIMFMSKPVFSM